LAQVYEGEVLAAALARAGGEADSSGTEASGATEQVERFAVIRYSESSLPRGLGASRSTLEMAKAFSTNTATPPAATE